MSATFGLLAVLPPARRLAFAEAALREPYPELQAAAFEELADPARLARPDLLVQHYGDLLPQVRARVAGRAGILRAAALEAIRTGGEWARRTGYEVLVVVDGFESVPELARGFHDPSSAVRDQAAGLLEGLALRYYQHLVSLRLNPDPQSRAFVERHRPVVLQAMPELLRTWPQHRKRVFLDIAVESIPSTYPVITDIVLARRDVPTYGAFLHALSETVSEAAVTLLFKLYLDARLRLREVAVEVWKKRADPGFPALVAAALSKLAPEDLAALASRVREVPWWPSGEAAASVDPVTAGQIIEFLARSGLAAEHRDQLIFSFSRSPHPEVRARALSRLRGLGSNALLDYAVGFLEDSSDAVRLEAVRTVLDLNPPDKERFLLPLLSSPNAEIRELVNREVTAAGFEKYMKSFDRLDPRTRELAARALAKIDPRITGRLAGELASLDPDRRLKALRIVEYVEVESDLRGLLVELLTDPDRRVRATVVKVLQLSGSADGMRLLAGALSDPDGRVRANAIEGFEDAGDPRSAALLLPLLDDADNRVRANAAKALWALGRRQEAGAALERMLRDPGEATRLSAVWALGEIRSPEALEARSREESSPAVRERIAEVLARLSGPPAPAAGAGG